MKTIPERFSKRQWDYLHAVPDSWLNLTEGGKRAGKNVLQDFAFCTLLETHKDKLFLIAGVTQGSARLNILDCDGLGIYNFFNGRYRKGKYEGKDAVIIQTKVGQKVLIVAGGGKKGDEAVIKGNTYGMVYITEANECHPDFIKEAFDRTLSSSDRKVFMDINPKAPNNWFYTDIVEFHAEKKKENAAYGFNYGHFTLVDNFSLSDDKIREILSTYDKKSIWYKRDIKGMRIQAEGLIYQQFADDPDRYLINEDYIKGATRKANLMKIVVGVDFGGNGSQHSFVATGYTANFKEVIPLASRIVLAKGTTPKDLEREFLLFCRMILDRYGFINECRCDSAEQVLIQGLKAAVMREQLPVQIRNAQKIEINERIRLVVRLISLNRIKLLKASTKTLQDALMTAVWDDTKFDDVRLDNGTSDIDTMDAFEYTLEPDRRNIMAS